MQRYSLSLFDQSGETIFADAFDCADEGGARALLSQKLPAFPTAHGFELREGNRLVFAGLTAKYRSEIYSQRDLPSVSEELIWSADASPKPDHLMLHSERLRAAYAYWDARRDGRLMPSRSDIDPTDIPKLLPYVNLIDVLSNPLDFCYRLIGTQVRSISRRDYTGLRFSEIEGKGNDSTLWRGCETVVHSKAPLSHKPPYVGGDVFVQNCENVLLPLSNDGINVTMILKVISFDRVQSGRPQATRI